MSAGRLTTSSVPGPVRGPGGASAVPGPLSPRLVRRASTTARVAGWVLIVLAVVLLLVATVLLGQEAGGAALLAGLAVPSLVIGLVPLRQRTVFDASGIRSRGLLGQTYLPWPGSRGAFVVDVSYTGRSTRTAVVEVPTQDGKVRLASPRAVRSSEDAARRLVEEDLDAIWSWAMVCGYVRETAPAWPQAGATPADTASGYVAAPGVPGAYGAPSSGYGAAPAGYGRVPQGGAPAAPPASLGPVRAVPVASGQPAPAAGRAAAQPVPAASLDQGLLAQEPLVLTGWPRNRKEAVAYVVAGCVLAVFGIGTMAVSSGARDLLVGGSGLVSALLLLGIAYTLVRSRLTVSREGLTCFDGLRTRRIAWPTSRSSIFVTAPRNQGRTVATVHVLAPDGDTVEVPGLRWGSGNEEEALIPAVRAAESLWAWGVSRGAARDDGGYRPAAKVETEQKRAAAARRLSYLLSQG